MKFYGASFFCEKGEGPVVEAKYDGLDDTYPITIKVKSYKTRLQPDVTFFLKNEEDYIAFKNSVIHAHSEYMKKRVEIVGAYDWDRLVKDAENDHLELCRSTWRL